MITQRLPVFKQNRIVEYQSQEEDSRQTEKDVFSATSLEEDEDQKSSETSSLITSYEESFEGMP